MNYFETEVKEIIKETSDSYSYVLSVPQGYEWKAGQHAMFKFKDYEVAEGDRAERVFTIASAPEDNFLMFTTRIGEQHTSFKEILLNSLKVGDKIMIATALGNFDFHMDGKDGAVVIAGGIGITPIRALLKHYSEKNKEAYKMTVIYSDDRGEFAYGNLWEDLKAKMPNLELHLVSEREKFTDLVNESARANMNSVEYLIAGSPGMNAAFTETLKGIGIDAANIITDNFMGY